ncbi:NAD(P)/FAD-dependent oxidoreductase [Variovorax paradoxus]|uniref:Rhodocoxin reductase n=1 Tax=Variovorax paradoxus TaxID=34073 RepID=A0A0H2M6X7_VARPD|nr:FAD-dependent oxidoreductase [Variovorax paradoxus]KLN52830.1 rhodocoxin reductase [Variovorax paradoxus]
MSSVVIIGAGHAGFQCAAALRQQGFDGDVILVGDEGHLPYQRPPLSKGYLLGHTRKDDLAFRAVHFFEANKIRMLTGRVEALDRNARRVLLRSGEAVRYDHLVLATGSRPRNLTVRGAELDGIYPLQTLDDADTLRGALKTCTRIVVIGAGFIGLEFAASARSFGNDVSVVDVADRPMARVLSPQTSQVFADYHRNEGTQLLMRTQVEAFEEAEGRATAVLTADGRRLPADLIVVGVGAAPCCELARESGLEVNTGVMVNASLVTSDPCISAIGDIAEFPHPRTDKSIRLESVQNATDQARAVASRLAGHAITPYRAVPWFWSDQGTLKLQIAGLSTPDAEHVLIGDTTSFSVLCIADGELRAVESVNRPADHMMARKLLTTRTSLVREQILNPGFSLRGL